MTPELSREQIEHIAETLRSFATAYPESIFTPFTPEETEEHSLIITRASGAMGRHCAQFMTEGANAIEQTLKAESSHAKSIEQINREAFRFVDLSPDEQSNRNGEYVPAELARKLQAELEAMTLERDGVVKYSGEYIASTDRHVAHLISKLDAAESQLTALTAGLLSERAKPSSLGQPVRRDTRTTYSSGRTTVSVEHFKADGTSEGSWGIDPQPAVAAPDVVAAQEKMEQDVIERIRFICVKSGVTSEVMGAICFSVREAMLPAEPNAAPDEQKENR